MLTSTLSAGGKFEQLAHEDEDSDMNALDDIDDFGGVPVPTLPAGYIPAN